MTNFKFRYEFGKCVQKYKGNHRIRKFPCYDQFLSIARKLYQNEELAIDLDYSLYAFDSTTIDLCLSLFPWAHFRKSKAAKMHTLLDL